MPKAVLPESEVVSLKVKRPRGFQAQLDDHNFIKRNSKCKFSVVVLEAISYLRERGEDADARFIELIRTHTNKVYKKKLSNAVNTYSDAKMKLLDALISHAEAYKKEYFVAPLEQMKLKLG